MPSTRPCDVLVVGGGIIGLVTAWRAAQRGLRAAVLDSNVRWLNTSNAVSSFSSSQPRSRSAAFA
ncbi:FAD-dependent oxidoreductase, partial [Streptomyces sp. S6]